MDNHLYNLMMQMTEEHKSLWRIRDLYQKDSASCVDCKAFWSKMIKDKEEHIGELESLIRGHMK